MVRSRRDRNGSPGDSLNPVTTSPKTRTFSRWGASLAKTFHLSGFKKAGFELRYVDGENLDRFSKYEFGFFSDLFIHGYQMERVRAESAWVLNTSYGFEMGELFRLQLIGDGAWATDEDTNLDQEFLGGVGVAGTVIGPWQTIVRLDLGAAVAGPDDGFYDFPDVSQALQIARKIP